MHRVKQSPFAAFCTSQVHYGMLWEIHEGTVHQILIIKLNKVSFFLFFSSPQVFSPPGIYGHCHSERHPTRNKPKRKAENESRGRKGQRMVRKRQEGCMGVQYFPLRGQPPVSFSAGRVLIHRSQGANTNLYSVCVIVFSLFLNTSFSCVVSWWSEISVSRDPYVKGNVVFTDTEAFQLSLSSLYDKLRAEITVGSESMAGC